MNPTRLNETLVNAFKEMSHEELIDFLHDFLDESKIDDLNKRFDIAVELNKAKTQRDIAKNVKASITTVSRVSKILKYGRYSYQRVFRN